MNTYFSNMDMDRDGFLTEKDLDKRLELSKAANPTLDAETERKHIQKVWLVMYNNGKEQPEGYKLSEKEFADNLWSVVNRPNFKEMLEPMTERLFNNFDLEKKGRVTKENFLKVTGEIISEEIASAAFDSADVEKSGNLTMKQMFDAMVFFYTNQDDEGNPLNHIMGPLVD